MTIVEEIKNILENNPKIEQILKKDHRSYLFTFKFNDKIYVYKEPIEKNTRKWQKFLAIFRGNESKREYYQMKKIISLGLLTANPLFFTDNYLVYEFIDGSKAKKEDLSLIINELKKIHSLGYLHGDSHLDNFILSREKNKVYIIDSKFQKNKFGKFGEIFELMYLEDSTGTILDYDKTSAFYKGAVLLRKYLTFFSNLKKFIRRK